MASKTLDLAALVQAAVAEALAGMQGDDTSDDTPKAKGRKGAPKGVGRESTFHAGVVKRLDLPRRRGASFQYHGKRGTTTWKVTALNADGGIVAQRTK